MLTRWHLTCIQFTNNGMVRMDSKGWKGSLSNMRYEYRCFERKRLLKVAYGKSCNLSLCLTYYTVSIDSKSSYAKIVASCSSSCERWKANYMFQFRCFKRALASGRWHACSKRACQATMLWGHIAAWRACIDTSNRELAFEQGEVSSCTVRLSFNG